MTQTTLVCPQCQTAYKGTLDHSAPFNCYECGKTLYSPPSPMSVGMMVEGYLLIFAGLLLSLYTYYCSVTPWP